MPDARALHRLLGLKEVLRKGWTRHPIARVESVADHSYGVMLLCWLLCPDGLDCGKVLEIALLHDLAEVVTGDLTPGDGVAHEVKNSEERRALNQLLAGFEAAERGEAALRDYQRQESAEARFVKAVDKLDMALQSQIYQLAYSCDLEEFRLSARPLLERSGLLGWTAS